MDVRAQEANAQPDLGTVQLRPGFDSPDPVSGRRVLQAQQMDETGPAGSSGSPNPQEDTYSSAANNENPPLDLTTASGSPVPLVTGSVPADRTNTNPREPRLLPQAAVGTPNDQGQLDPRGNVAAAAVEPGTIVSDATPFAATGIRLGVFDLFPTLEQSIGYSSNSESTQKPVPSAFSETAVGLRLQSNWSRHQLQAELGATYQKFFNGGSEPLPRGNASSTLRLDLRRDYTLTLRGGYNYSTESANSSNLVVGGGVSVIDRPAVHVTTTSAEFARTEGKLRFLLRGALERSIYEDANLSNGTKLFQGDRDNWLATGTARLSWQASPAVSPFVEASIGKRTYYQKIDSNGNRRDSTLYALRGGVALDFGEKLRGQLSAGYTAEDFKDNAINTLGALTLDGSITWSPVRLTNVTASLATTLSPSANLNDNGSVNYAASLGISRQVRPNLLLDARLTGSLQDYDTTGRRDIGVGVDVGYTYWFNRFVAATGRASYQKLDSTAAGSSYDVGTVRFGLKFQR